MAGHLGNVPGIHHTGDSRLTSIVNNNKADITTGMQFDDLVQFDATRAKVTVDLALVFLLSGLECYKYAPARAPPLRLK